MVCLPPLSCPVCFAGRHCRGRGSHRVGGGAEGAPGPPRCGRARLRRLEPSGQQHRLSGNLDGNPGGRGDFVCGDGREVDEGWAEKARNTTCGGGQGWIVTKNYRAFFPALFLGFSVCACFRVLRALPS
jgi:hypothetical protein